MAEELTTEERLRLLLSQATSVTVDGMSVSNANIKDAIALEQYLAVQTRRRTYPMGRRIKFLPPGAV